MANEVATLQQTEFGEVEEPFLPGKGSSSTMPQKRNPILCEVVVGIARLASQLPAAMLAAMMPEHERAMGEWHIEWDVIPRTCLLTAAALRHSGTIMAGLVVHADVMRRNLGLSEGAIVAEAVMMHLAKDLGHEQAHDRVYDACLRAIQKGEPLRAVLLADAEIAAAVSEAELDQLLDPASYVGLASRYVDLVAGTGEA
jgi:3-carboxy-cis,cis-muconate cycloisomerase